MTRLEDEDARWIVHGERPVYENEWITVGLADISQPSGERFEHHAHAGAKCGCDPAKHAQGMTFVGGRFEPADLLLGGF